MTLVTIDGARGEMPVYVAKPAGDGPWPGVLVISDALGMTTDLRNQTDWLADEGYFAVAPDLYYWGGRIRCMFTAMRQFTAGEGEIFDDLAAVHELACRPGGLQRSGRCHRVLYGGRLRADARSQG